jgi:hypothetical protein
MAIIRRNAKNVTWSLVMRLYTTGFFFLIFSFNTFASLEETALQNYIKSLPNDTRGDWSSGGGNSVVCFKKEFAKKAIEAINSTHEKHIPNFVFDNDWIESVEMYDLFEARLPRGIDSKIPEIIDIADDETLESYIINRKARFDNLSEGIQNAFEEGMELIPSSRIRFYNGGLIQQNDTDDFGIVDVERCVVQTMAAQRNWGNHFELYIDSRLFNHKGHSRLSKAVLLIHEYIYAYSRWQLSHEFSSRTRKLVELIITYDKDSLRVSDVLKSVYDLGYSLRFMDSPYMQLLELSALSETYRELYKLMWKLEAPIRTYTPDNFYILTQRLNELGLPVRVPVDAPLSLVDAVLTEMSLTPYADQIEEFWPQIEIYRKERRDFIHSILRDKFENFEEFIDKSNSLISEEVKSNLKVSLYKIEDKLIHSLEKIITDRYDTRLLGKTELWVLISNGEWPIRVYLDNAFREAFKESDFREDLLNLAIPKEAH